MIKCRDRPASNFSERNIMPLLSVRVIITVCLFNLSLCVFQLSAAPLNPARIPSDTKWLLHFDLQKARNWQLMQKWQKQLEGKAWYRDKISEMADAYGWNPVVDLKGISMYDNQYAQFSGVLALHVRNINPEKIASQFQKLHPDAETGTYRGRTISTWSDSSMFHGEHSLAGCLFNNSLILIANNSEKIKASIDVLAGDSPGLTEGSPLLDSFHRQALLSFRAIDIPDMHQAGSRNLALKWCQNVTMFFDAGDDLMRLQYDLQAKNSELASKIKGAVSGMWAMMGMKMKQSLMVKQMLNAVQIRRDGNHVLVNWEMKTEIFEKMTGAMKGKKWSKMKGKLYRKQSGKVDDTDEISPKEASGELSDEWIESFKL